MTLAEVLKELRELDQKGPNGRYNSFHTHLLSVATLLPRADIQRLLNINNYLPGLLQVIEKQREALEEIKYKTHRKCLVCTPGHQWCETTQQAEYEIACEGLAFDPFKEEK